MKLNFDKQFVNLKGHPLPVKMDETLANELALSAKGEPRKMIKWAMDLINSGEIEVDKKEVVFLKGLVQASPILSNLAKDQLLDRLDKVLEIEI